MGFSFTQHCTVHRHPTHVQHTTQYGSPLKGVKIQRKEGISTSFIKERMEKVGCTQLYNLLKYGIIGYMYS